MLLLVSLGLHTNKNTLIIYNYPLIQLYTMYDMFLNTSHSLIRCMRCFSRPRVHKAFQNQDQDQAQIKEISEF